MDFDCIKAFNRRSDYKLGVTLIYKNTRNLQAILYLTYLYTCIYITCPTQLFKQRDKRQAIIT
jgi:hypothetical protein